MKSNVGEFNSDIAANGGYQYTTNAPYSSIVANRRMSEAIFAAIPVGTRSILDAGCGDGTYTSELVEKFPDAQIVGLDPAEEAVERARRLEPNAEFIVGDILSPSTLPARKFDVAILRGVVHHLSDGPAGILNTAALCDTLIIVEPNGNNPILKWIEKNSKYHIEHEEQSFSCQELDSWCKSAGFKKVGLEYIGFIPMFFPTGPAKLIHFVQPFFEQIYPIKKYLSGQIVLSCSEKRREDARVGP